MYIANVNPVLLHSVGLCFQANVCGGWEQHHPQRSTDVLIDIAFFAMLCSYIMSIPLKVLIIARDLMYS